MLTHVLTNAHTCIHILLRASTSSHVHPHPQACIHILIRATTHLQGVHVVTVNDYLARRDSEWVGQVQRFLGLSVGLVQQGLSVCCAHAVCVLCSCCAHAVCVLRWTCIHVPLLSLLVLLFQQPNTHSVHSPLAYPNTHYTHYTRYTHDNHYHPPTNPLHPHPQEAERRTAYNCDVTYVTNSELGFDFLRDNLAQTGEDLVLRAFNFCVIDEVDSILIDEARTPLIISGPAEAPSEKYFKACKLADALARDVHYTVDEKQRNVLLTDDGYEAAEDVLQVGDLYDPREQWASYLINAIKAKELFLRDVSYIVRGGEVIIVDEFTGRTMPGRRWGDGLHQAIEAKEQMAIQNETVTLASISYQVRVVLCGFVWFCEWVHV